MIKQSLSSAKVEPIIDVLVCVFPSSQCAFLLPFAKVIIIRFMHRFNHHVWVQGQRNGERLYMLCLIIAIIKILY